MKVPRIIVCATDLREGGDPAIVEADLWARRYEAVLAFVHVVPEPSRTHILFPQLAQRTFDRMPALMSLTADAVAGRVERLTSRTRGEMDIRVDVGSPAAIITSVTEELQADLVVIGATADAGMAGPLGSVALRVVRHAHSPVLVVRAPKGEGPVLCASDLSDPAFPAIVAGADLARSVGAELAVIHVADLPLPMEAMPEVAGLGLALASPEATGFGTGFAPTEAEHQLLREAARDSLYSAMTRLKIEGQAIVEEGAPAPSIVAAARRLGARFLVMGTEGRTGLRRMLLGSTAEQILQDAPCSVLVVRLHSQGDPS